MFLPEAFEAAESLYEDLLRALDSPLESRDLGPCRRGLHNLKGAAAGVQFAGLARFCHELEGFLNAPGAKERSQLEAALDGVEEILSHLDRAREGAPPEPSSRTFDSFLEELFLKTEVARGWLEGPQQSEAWIFALAFSKAEPLLELRVEQVLKQFEAQGEVLATHPAPAELAAWARTPSSHVFVHFCPDPRLGGESLAEKIQLPEMRDLRRIHPRSEGDRPPEGAPLKPLPEEPSEPRSSPGESSLRTVRVELQKIEAQLRNLGELSNGLRQLRELHRELSRDEALPPSRLLDLEDSLDSQEAKLEELSQGLVDFRMVKLKKTFRRFPRMVTGLAASLGKRVHFEIEGAETELDASLVDAILDPLVHLLRNAVDHGIETPEVRSEKGKDPEGRILLRARGVGREVWLEVEDDGAGLDPESIAQKGQALGWEIPSRDQFLRRGMYRDWLFRPGFSTRSVPGEVSGRGIGLDVVARGSEALEGRVEVLDREPAGTLFRIRVPLTRVRSRCLLVRSKGHLYALPLAVVQEVLSVDGVEFEEVPDLGPVARWRQRSVPYVELSELLGLAPGPSRFLVLVQRGRDRCALGVEAIEGRRPLILQPLTPHFDLVEGISGASLSEEGSVVLVLDLSHLGTRAPAVEGSPDVDSSGGGR